MRRTYQVNGLRLAVDVKGTAEESPIESYVAPFAEPGLEPGYVIAIRRGEIPPGVPAGAEILHEGEIAPGFPTLVARRGREQWLVVHGLLSIVSDATRRISEIYVSSECERWLEGYAGIHAIDASLAASGQFLVHGAALSLPWVPDHALLMLAPSGVGKTTTALALALGGFGLMTDDAIVLQPNGTSGAEAACAWGLPRALKVHRNTAAMLPALAPALGEAWDGAGEQVLTLAKARDVVPVLAPAPKRVAAILMLGPRAEGAHRIRGLGKAKALTELAADNLRRAPGGVDPDQARRFGALSQLVSAVPTYELNVGSGLADLPLVVREALTKAGP